MEPDPRPVRPAVREDPEERLRPPALAQRGLR
ncbi:hypothetical protein LINPERPRIM_LOCUS15572 [Linum perenne]